MAGVGPPMAGRGDVRDSKADLPTYIYDYLLKKGKQDLARALLHSDLGVKVRPRTKTSPGSREVNGMDDSGDLDSKDQLPLANITLEHLPETSFLQEWWSVFWDLWHASKPKPGVAPGSASAQYFNHSERARQNRDSRLNAVAMGNMNPMQPNFRQMMANGMPVPGNMNADMRRSTLANNARMMVPPGMRNMPGQNPMGQTPMQREGSDMERPQSPMSGENAPSPKRQKLDGPMGNQAGKPPMPNGAGQTPNMMQNGFDPSMPGAFNMPMPGGKPMQPFGPRAFGQGGMNVGADAFNRGAMGTPGGVNSPLMPAPEGLGMGDFSMQQARQMNNNPNQQGGALADYQMQLMLLEQQNKKRLLMARQEQDITSQPGQMPGPGGQAMMGGGQPPFPHGAAMSPRGSRNGSSPSPNGPPDQMKRNTPGVAQASPRPDGGMQSLSRSSPAPGTMDPSRMPPQMQQPIGMASMGMMPNGVGPGAPGMNGPNGMTPQHMEMLRRSQGGGPPGHWPNGAPPGAQMPTPTMQPTQQGQNENQPRNNMPPPPGPTAGRTNPPSPAQTPAPPTPAQNKSANSKNKKDSKDSKKKTQKKGTAGAGATPSTELDHNAQTPTPKTPTSPKPPPNALSNPPPNAQAQGINGPQQPQNSQAPPGVPSQPDGANAAQPFGSLEGNPSDTFGDFNMDFANPMDNSEVLEGFDFDAFLHMDGGTNNSDFADFNVFNSMDNVPMGANEG